MNPENNHPDKVPLLKNESPVPWIRLMFRNCYIIRRCALLQGSRIFLILDLSRYKELENLFWTGSISEEARQMQKDKCPNWIFEIPEVSSTCGFIRLVKASWPNAFSAFQLSRKTHILRKTVENVPKTQKSSLCHPVSLGEPSMLRCFWWKTYHSRTLGPNFSLDSHCILRNSRSTASWWLVWLSE